MTIARIATYNIRCGLGMDGRLDLKRTARVLEGLDADVICLQEVDVNRARTLYSNQAEKLAGLLCMDYCFGAALNYSGGGAYGNAILSKHEICKSLNHRLPGQGSKRGMQEIEVDMEGSIISIFNTHMELDKEQRLHQIESFIIPIIDKCKGPAALCGDFNEKPNWPGVSILSTHLQDSFKANSGALNCTFPSDEPKARIDYIFLNENCRVIDYSIVKALASDHLPVLVTMEI